MSRHLLGVDIIPHGLSTTQSLRHGTVELLWASEALRIVTLRPDHTKLLFQVGFLPKVRFMNKYEGLGECLGTLQPRFYCLVLS